MEKISDLSPTRVKRFPPALSSFVFRLWHGFLWFNVLMGIDLVVLFGITLLLLCVVRSVQGQINWLHQSLAFPLAIIVGLIFIDFFKWVYFLVARRENNARHFLRQIPSILRDWIPFLLIDLMYENLHDLSPHLTHYDITQSLYRFDTWLFGVSPTIWAQKIFSPLMTDLMSVFYAIYLALPLGVMSFLTLSGRRDHFQKISIAVAFTFLIGFAGYVLTPALPPRFYIAELFTNPVQLEGAYLYQMQTFWDKYSVVKGAAFPSLHVALSSTALIYAFRFRNLCRFSRVQWYLYIPSTVGLWFSTIYLRHHWVGDIFAGWFVAMMAAFISDRLISGRTKLADRFGLMRSCAQKNTK